MAGYLEQAIAKVKEFERSVPWMYRDAKGAVAVGAGHRLPDANSAALLPFLMGDDPADAGQIKMEFERVQDLPVGELPSFYRMVGAPELSLDGVDDDVRANLAASEQTFRSGLPAYDTLPDGVKMAFLDMAYTLGAARVLTNYPHMLSAIETGSWAQAAKECVRANVSPERNAWTRQQMLTAVVATIRAGFREEAKTEPTKPQKSEGLAARLLRGFTGRPK